MCKMLTFEQVIALNKAKAGHSLLICGQAGTGKTHLIKQIVSDLENNRKVSLLCTTGMGCLQYTDLGATTVHSFAGLQDGRFDALTLQNLVKYDEKYYKVRENVKVCATLIIDEISMLSMKDFEQLELVCRVCRNNNTCFGGIQVILCGDFYQLPPVASPLHNDNGQFCFESEMFKKCIPHRLVLSKVMRQSEDILVRAVRETAVGCVSNEVDFFLRSLERPLEGDLQDVKHLFSRNYDSAVFNNSCLAKIETEGKLYRALKNSGDQKYLRKILAPHYLHLKVSCPVVLLCNLGGKLVNGLSGIVKQLEEDHVHVFFEEIKGTHRFGRHKFTQYSTYKKCVVAEREQFPFHLGYGLSIHKSQGMTLSSVVVHCQGIFEAGQLSVAIGRAVTSKGLSLIGYRKGLCLQPKHVITSFYGAPTSPLLDDLSCCRSLEVTPINTDLETLIVASNSDDSDFNDSDLMQIDNAVQDYHTNLDIIEQSQSMEELPEYINADDLKMHCFMKTPATHTHEKVNDICTGLNIDRLRCFCQIQLKRINELTSDLTFENKCTPKQWTSILGTNHKYCETPQYTSSVKALFCVTGEICKEHKLVASSIITELLKAEIHHRCNARLQGSGSSDYSADMSDAGKAKVRYVAGMCVAKLKNHYMNIVISNQNNPDKSVQKNVKNSNDKVEVLKLMVGDETLDYEHDKTLQEIERRQNARRGLTHVSDLSFQFFMTLLNKICNTLNAGNFRLQGGDIFEWTYSQLINDDDLQMLFSEISILCKCENSEIPNSVFKELIHKFLMVSHKQFLKDTKDRLNIIKKKAHREEISRKAEKRKSEVQITMKDIVSDQSEDRAMSHMKLKLNCIANNSYLCGRDFTKSKLRELCEAYGVECSSTMKKPEIASTLNQVITKCDKMLNPEVLSGEVIPSASYSQTARPSKRQKKPGKGKGKGKGKKKTDNKYICRVCKEEYIEGEEWIQCDDCNSWVHRTCENVIDQQWEVLQEEDIPWSCSHCSQE